MSSPLLIRFLSIQKVEMATLAELVPPQYGYVMIVASVSHMAILDILLVQLLAGSLFRSLDNIPFVCCA